MLQNSISRCGPLNYSAAKRKQRPVQAELSIFLLFKHGGALKIKFMYSSRITDLKQYLNMLLQTENSLMTKYKYTKKTYQANSKLEFLQRSICRLNWLRQKLSQVAEKMSTLFAATSWRTQRNTGKAAVSLAMTRGIGE